MPTKPQSFIMLLQRHPGTPAIKPPIMDTYPYLSQVLSLNKFSELLHPLLKTLNFRLIYNKLPVRDHIQRHSHRGPANCLFCPACETTQHLFLSFPILCPIGDYITTSLSPVALVPSTEEVVFPKNIRLLLQPDQSRQSSQTIDVMLSIYTYVLWRERCNRPHGKLLRLTLEHGPKIIS